MRHPLVLPVEVLLTEEDVRPTVLPTAAAWILP